METLIVLENATLVEAVRRLEKVTPRRGSTNERVMGILFEISPGEEWPLVVRSTNQEVFYREWVNVLDSQGDKVTWRIPSQMFASIISKLPIGSGKMVKLMNEGNTLHIQSGRFKAKLQLIDPRDYPTWDIFSTAELSSPVNLGSRLEQVSWATAKGIGGSALSGVRINGKTLAATDKYRLVTVPLDFSGLDNELVVPLGNIVTLIKEFGDMRIGASGNKLILSPNDYTQILCLVYEVKFPNIERVMSVDHPNFVTVSKARMVEMIARVAAADSTNRLPEMTVFVGEGEIAFFVKEFDGSGSAGDAIELPEQAQHGRYNFRVNPVSFAEAIQAAPGDNINLYYDPSDARKILYVSGDHGFKCWIVPIVPGAQVER